MNALKLPRDQVAALRSEDLQQYLSSRGWRPDPAASWDLATVYHHPSHPDAEILAPRQRDIADYVLRMADAAQTLAEVEGQSIQEVLHDLATPSSNLIRLRVLSPESSLGTVPLAEGLALLSGGRDLLLAAACSAHQPQSYFPRQSFAPVTEFVRSCRLGQTERGSFTATILAPVPPTIEPSLFPVSEEDLLTDEPYERRVTLYLMDALQTIQAAIEGGRPQDILQGVRRGVSANLCEALASMSPASPQARVEVFMAWSATRPRVPQRIRSQVSFGQGEFAVIREAGRRLREQIAPRLERVAGFPISLHAEAAGLFVGFEGRVILRTEVNGRATRVRMILGAEDYARACDAHRDRLRVAATGVLHRDPEAKVSELQDPQDFQVLPPEPTT